MPAEPPSSENTVTQLQCPACSKYSAPRIMFCPCGHEFDPAHDTVTTSTRYTRTPGPPLTIRKVLTLAAVSFLVTVLVVIGLGLSIFGNGFWDFLPSFALLALIGLLLFGSYILGAVAFILFLYILWSARKP